MFEFTQAPPAEHIPLRQTPPQPMDMLPASEQTPLPMAPVPYQSDAFDLAPCDAIVELQRQAMPVLRQITQMVTESENNLTSLEISRPVRLTELCRRLVENGTFHTDKDGVQLVRHLRCGGKEHMKHLLNTGELYSDGYRAVAQRSLAGGGSSAVLFTMLHSSVPSISDLYQHPDVLAMAEPIVDHEVSEAQRILSDHRQNLHDFKQVTKKRLQQLEKQFKAMLD